jgi:hypothetical protein
MKLRNICNGIVKISFHAIQLLALSGARMVLASRLKISGQRQSVCIVTVFTFDDNFRNALEDSFVA